MVRERPGGRSVSATISSAELTLFPPDAPVRIERTTDALRMQIPESCEVSIVDAVQGRLEITLGKGARLTHYQEVNGKTDFQSFVEVDVAESAAFLSNVFLLGQGSMRSTIHVRLSGEKAECSLNGLYLGAGDQKIETQTLVEHQKPQTVSRQLYKGILDGQSRGSFDGLVIVQKEAQKTDAVQSNKNLLLSSKAIAKSNPELKIFANDVKCKHGSTIGQIDAGQLFYLRSRGISSEDARRLLVNAFANEMVDSIELAPFKETIQSHLHV